MQSAESPLMSSGSTESSESRRLQSTSTRPRTPSLSRSGIWDPADRHLHQHLYCELKLNKMDECALQILRPCMQLTLHCAYMGYIPSNCKFGLDQ